MKRTLLLLNGCAVLLLLVTIVWGALLYPGLPDSLTTHWDFAGTADGFSRKSFLAAFGLPLAGLGLTLLLSGLSFPLTWNHSLVPAERRASGLVLGLASLHSAAIFSWLSFLSWLDTAPGPLFLAFVLLGSLPLLIVFGLHVPAITRERKQRSAGKEPAFAPEYWVMGGLFYRNPADPRVFVPKPPHTGYGMTVNIATAGGRIFLWGTVLLLIGVLLLPVLISLSRRGG